MQLRLTLSIKGSPIETRILDTEGIYIRDNIEKMIEYQRHNLRVKYARDISLSEDKWEIYLTVKSAMHKPIFENTVGIESLI